MSTAIESSDYLDERYFDLRFSDLTIPKGDSSAGTTNGLSSNDLYVKDKLIVGMDMTPDNDCWTAAAITFLAAPTTVSSDFQNVYDDTGNEYSVSVDVNRHIVLTPSHFSSMRYIKIRSGTSSTPVDQADARTVRLWYRSA